MQRVTYPQACVLQALGNGRSFGMDIIEHTGLASGTVYPMLRRFERDGLVESTWETPEEAFGNRRPQRRHYRLTRSGVAALVEARERYRQHVAVFGDPAAGAEPVG